MAYFKNSVSIKRRPRAGLLTIGTELLTGSVLNTNAAYLGRELTKLGFEVHWQGACRDEQRAIKEALRRALEHSEVTLVSGGLGPTPDDVTRESLADFFNTPLVLSKVQYRMILRHYQKRGKAVPSMVKREACFPTNAKPVLNRFGVALGFVIEEEGRIVIVLPGVPGELTRLFETRLRPFLRKKFPGLRPAASLVVKTVGLSEPTVMKRLGNSFFKGGNFQFGIYPTVGEASLRIYADSPRRIRQLRKRIVKVLGGHVYSFSDEPLEAVIGKQLRTKHGTVSVAESCTGGKVMDQITAIPGASHYFRGGVIAYQNEMKTEILDVPFRLIHQKGAVSEASAKAMAQGVRKRFDSTLGIAVTGIAGPGGGTVRKPVGLVYIAISSSTRWRVWEERFGGDREQIQMRAAKKALEYLWRWLQNQKSVPS